MPTAAPVYRLTSDSALSEDRILTADVLVDLQSSAPVGVYDVDGQPQTLFIRADGVLCQLVPTSGASSAGWSVSTVGSTSQVKEVAVGVQQDGTVHAFYTDKSNLYRIANSGGAWSAPQVLSHCSGLRVATNGLTGELIAYGIDANGNLLFLREQNGQWTAASLDMGSSLVGSRPVLTLTDAACDWVLAVPGTAASGGQLDLYQGSPTAKTAGPMAVPVANAVAQVLVGTWQSNSVVFLFTDIQGNLYSNLGTTANVLPLKSGKVNAGAAIVDTDNVIHFYPIDPDGTLSVLHQVGWDNAAGPTWAPYIPLDTGFEQVFADSNPMDAAAFFAVDAEGALWYSFQDPDTYSWRTSKAQMPGGAKAYAVAQYRTRVRVVDQNGNPASKLALTVTTAGPSGVLVGGLWYPTSSTQAATVSTDATGCVTLSTIALGASTPALSFSAPGLTPTEPVNPAASIHAYLAGTGTLNAGTSRALPTFGPTTLAGATVGGQPLAPAAAKSDDVAKAAAQGIIHMFTANPGTQGMKAAVGYASAAAAPAGFILDLTDLNAPSFTTFGSATEIRAAERAHIELAAATDTLLGSWWDAIKHFFEDVWNGIKNAAIAVTKWVVNVVDKTVSLVVKIGEEIHHIVGQIVHGIEEAAAVVQSIFAAIGAEIEKIVDWLKMLFDWGDIWNTKKALSSAIEGAFPYLADQITWFRTQVVDKFFTNLEGQVKTAFNAVIGQFTGGQTLASLRNPPSQVRGKLGSAGSFLGDIEKIISAVQNNWLIEKIESFWGGGPSIDSSDLLTKPMNDLQTAMQKAGDDFADACEDFWDSFKTMLSDPSNFATLGVAEFLDGVKHLALAVLEFLDGIIDALLDVLAAACQSVGNLLSVPFRIPIVSSILDDIADLLGIHIPSVTVADLFALGLALPITIAYKLKYGVSTQPFPGGRLPTGDLHPTLSRMATADVAGAAPGAAAGDAAEGCKYAAVVIAALWALFDTGLDAIPDGDAPKALGVIDVVAPTLIGVLTWPGGIPFTKVALDSSEDKANFANWIIGWGVVAVDVAVFVVGSVKWAEGSVLARYNDPAGKIVLSAIGAINLVSGIVASSLGASGGAIAANILGPLPNLFQFLRLEALVDASEGITLAVKLVLDFFAGEGTAVAIAKS